jgi:serine/threonine protein kinase
LEEFVEQSGALPYHQAADFVAQAAIGLDHAHNAGLIHRDVKPANLLVDRQGTVKVLDMGLAKFTAEVRPVPEFARDEQVLGTAAYFAPEQAVNSQTVDGRADIYGLGCTLYYLLTGHPPFQGETPLELMTAHHRDTAPSVLVDRPDAPPELVAICQRMMEKSPRKRYQTARDVAEALSRWLDDERAAGRLAGKAEGGTRSPKTHGQPSAGDTHVNLQETAKIERTGARPSSHVFAPLPESSRGVARTSESDVLVPPPPPMPPVVPPPRDSERAPVLPVAPRAAPTELPAHELPVGTSPAAPLTARVKTVGSAQRRARSASGWWSIALATLVLCALGLALVALGS